MGEDSAWSVLSPPCVYCVCATPLQAALCVCADVQRPCVPTRMHDVCNRASHVPGMQACETQPHLSRLPTPPPYPRRLMPSVAAIVLRVPVRGLECLELANIHARMHAHTRTHVRARRGVKMHACTHARHLHAKIHACLHAQSEMHCPPPRRLRQPASRLLATLQMVFRWPSLEF